MKLSRIIERAEREVKKSPYNVKVSAVLFDNRGRIISTGYNHPGVLGKILGKHSVHAEMDALQKVVKPSPNLNILIFREKDKPIDPCECCQELLNTYQIRKIYHKK